MPLAAPEEEVLSLIVDEVWDLTAAIDELERRRKKLRDAILDLCRKRSVSRWAHTGGALRIDQYVSYRAPRPSLVMPLLRERGWEDATLTVRGRPLHELAQRDADAGEWLRARLAEQRHEVLVMTPARRGPRR